MKNADLRAKLHTAGKHCLAAATATAVHRDELGTALVEVHACVELLLELIENVDDEVEARVIAALALEKLRREQGGR